MRTVRMVIETDVRGFAAAAERLHGMKIRAGNALPAWEALIAWWADQNVRQFTTRGARWKTPWKPLRLSTIREKRRLGYPVDPLIRTEQMMRQLTRRPLGFERYSQESVTAGTRLRRAYLHQRGTRYMAARRLVNAAQVQREGAATSAIRTWILHGHAEITTREAHR